MVPVEGVVGRLMAGLLVVYLNIQGAWVVAVVLAAAGLYFASAISFWVIRESLADRWVQFAAWRDRWRNRREERAELRAEHEAVRVGARSSPFRSRSSLLLNRPRIEDGAIRPPAQPPSVASSAPQRAPQQDPLDEIPAYQRAMRRMRTS